MELSVRLLPVFVVLVFSFMNAVLQVEAAVGLMCNIGPCRGRVMRCPAQCPIPKPSDPKAKACYLNCMSPVCKAQCRNRVPNCNGVGSACYDPRFIGGDGVVFYFHGKSNQHFSLVSDRSLQINSRFIGHRPAGRNRDYTWIQALGILFGSHTFSVEATRVEVWDGEIDHLKFTYDGIELVLPEGLPSSWSSSSEDDILVERASSGQNSAIIILKGTAEILVNVVPVTKEDDRIHNYQLPSNDCFAHLEVQFRFFGLSPEVEGVLGRTYRLDFENPAKPGVAMPVVGGEDKYRTSSLLSSDCLLCKFSPDSASSQHTILADVGNLDCTQGSSGGHGIVCKK